MRRLIPMFILFPCLAQAGDDLTRAARLLEDMEYQKAMEVADTVLQSASSGPGDLVAAYRIRGLCLSATGKLSAALEDFRRLLAIDPAYRLSDDISPKLAAPFYQAVAMTKNQKPISLTHRKPEPREFLSGLELKVHLEADPLKMVRKIRLRYETDEDPEARQTAVPVERPSEVTLSLPGKLRAREVRYYFEALGSSGGVLARAGNEQEPFHVRVAVEPTQPPPEVADSKEGERPPTFVANRSSEFGPQGEDDHPATDAISLRDEEEEEDDSSPAWYTSWWFWTAVGVVAAAGITTGTVLGLQADGGSVDYRIRIEPDE